MIYRNLRLPRTGATALTRPLLSRSICFSIPLLLFLAALPARAEPIPGYTLRGGKYLLDEPFSPDRPRPTGLQLPFPPMQGIEDNPLDPAKVRLGKFLFFDPILSGSNRLSCSHCHHPDLSFADGRATSMGRGGEGFGPGRTGGEPLTRNAPSLWNVAFAEWQFADGRARTLEEQATVPITSEIEMNQDPVELVNELRSNPEYVGLFNAAFGKGDKQPVSIENVARALSSFERTLLSFGSKFDRYAAGDFSAFTQNERNGLRHFRSLQTRCFECHSFPNFADGSFRVIGVPDDGETDLGRGAVSEFGPDLGFKVPSLRNVALSAPYMHNGKFETLREVVEFYSEGGGHAEEELIAGIDAKIFPFDVTPEQIDEIVAFLETLTDTSLQPEAPSRVPSGLPVVEVQTRTLPMEAKNISFSNRRERDEGEHAGARPVVHREAKRNRPVEIIWTEQAVGAMERLRTTGPPQAAANLALADLAPATFSVSPGQSIGEAIDRARPGDRIEVFPGVYNESFSIAASDIALAGIEQGGNIPVLDGLGRFDHAVVVSGDRFRMEGFVIRGYNDIGIVSEESANPVFRSLVIYDPPENKRSKGK